MKFLDQFQTSIKFVLIIFGCAFSNCNSWWQHNRVTWRWKCLRNCWFKKSFCMSELALLHPIDFQPITRNSNLLPWFDNEPMCSMHNKELSQRISCLDYSFMSIFSIWIFILIMKKNWFDVFIICHLYQGEEKQQHLILLYERTFLSNQEHVCQLKSELDVCCWYYSNDNSVF